MIKAGKHEVEIRGSKMDVLLDLACIVSALKGYMPEMDTEIRCAFETGMGNPIQKEKECLN